MTVPPRSLAEKLASFEDDFFDFDDASLPDLTPEQSAELSRRIAEHDANPQDAIPWEEVKRAALERLRR